MEKTKALYEFVKDLQKMGKLPALFTKHMKRLIDSGELGPDNYRERLGCTWSSFLEEEDVKINAN